MNILMIVCTHYQLFVAIQLKKNIFSADNVDVVFANTMYECTELIENLKKESVFRSVYKEREITLSCFKDKLIFFRNYMLYSSKGLESFTDTSFDYDEVLFYNIEVLMYYLCRLSQKNSKNVKISRFEEGFASYFFIYFKSFSEKAKLILNIKSIEKNIEKYYFFNPDLATIKDYNYTYEKIPYIDKSDKELQRLFATLYHQNTSTDGYKEKYIFFENCFSDNGSTQDDFPLILKIAEIVGKENLLIKLHPRSVFDRFAPYGIKTNSKTAIPWEALFLCQDFSDRVFITINSGSVISPIILFNESIKTFFLSKIVNFEIDPNQSSFLHAFLQKYEPENFSFPNTEEIFMKELRGYHEEWSNQ